MFILLLGCLSPIGGPDLLAEVQQRVADIWGEGRPARSLRVKCLMTLKVEHKDPALDDPYLPNYGASPSAALPQTRWTEEIGRRGSKHYGKYRFMTPTPGAPPPRDIIYLSNGQTSYRHEPANTSAQKFWQVPIYTQLVEDYYGDMIGFPGKIVSPTRSVPGELSEPFAVDQILASGKYRVEGEEDVEGEPCLILGRPGLDRLWLAKRKGLAVVRREWRWTVDGPLKRCIRNANFRPIADGAWLPHVAEMEIYGHPTTVPGRRVGVLRAEVQEAEADVPDSLFEPHFPPNTLVRDMDRGTQSLVGADDPTLDGIVKRVADLPPMFRPVPWYERVQPYAIGIAAIAIAAAAWLAMKRRRA